MGEPVQSVGLIRPENLRSQFGSERPATDTYREECRRTWHRLQVENAPFRIVTSAGLVSAPVDCFGPQILERVTAAWKRVARVIGEVIGYNSEPYMQVGEIMLLERVVSLVERRKLLADGDPWEMRSCHVRLPS